MRPFRHTVFFLTLPAVILAAGLQAQLAAQPVWTDLSPASPPTSRFNHGMVHDSDRGRIVVFGGASTVPVLGTILGDTWEWDGSVWSQMFPANSPGPLAAPIMVYDPVRAVTVLFGGAFAGGLSGDVWEWDGQDWTRVSFANGPVARVQFAATWSDAMQAVVIHGGLDASFPLPMMLGDTWAYDGSWRPIGIDTQPAHSHVLAAYGSMLYVVGGLNALFPGSWSDVYRMDMSAPSPSWSEVTRLRGVLNLAGASFFTDSSGRLTYIHGGSNQLGVSNNTLIFNPVGEELFELFSSLAERPPASSGGRFAMWSSGKAIHFGGSGNAISLDDFYELDVAGRAISIASMLPGCDTGGPTVKVTEAPVLGGTFRIEVDDNLSTGAVAMLMGFQDQAYGNIALPAELTPYGMPGCVLHTDILFAPALTTIGNTAQFDLPIPNLMHFDGTTFFNQAIVVAPGANALGLLLSGKVSSQIGM